MLRLTDVRVWIGLLFTWETLYSRVQGGMFKECIYLMMVNDIFEQKERGQLVLGERGVNWHQHCNLCLTIERTKTLSDALLVPSTSELCMIREPSASAGSITLDSSKQNLHFNRIPKWFIYAVNPETYWSRICIVSSQHLGIKLPIHPSKPSSDTTSFKKILF